MYLSRTTCDTIEKEIAREKYKVVRDYKVSSYWNDPAQQWDNPELRAETIARLNKMFCVRSMTRHISIKSKHQLSK